MYYNKLKSKAFFGTFNDTADKKFNDWIESMDNHCVHISIKEFKYQQVRYGDHSICILYEEEKAPKGEQK